MKKTYQTRTAAAATDELVMPESVTLAMADLAGTVEEGLLALAVGAGFGVMQVMMQESVTGLCGPKGVHDPARSAVRHGSENGSVTLGGRRVPVRRPRVRSADRTTELAVPAYEVFASTDPLGALVLQRMMAKLSTRRYRAGLEPVGAAVEASASSTSKSAVSRRFVAATETALAEMLAADLSGLDLVALMIDGVHPGSAPRRLRRRPPPLRPELTALTVDQVAEHSNGLVLAIGRSKTGSRGSSPAWRGNRPSSGGPSHSRRRRGGIWPVVRSSRSPCAAGRRRRPPVRSPWLAQRASRSGSGGTLFGPCKRLNALDSKPH